MIFLTRMEEKKESKQVSGNSNRFVVEETDLSLEGKNGLNVEITREDTITSYLIGRFVV